MSLKALTSDISYEFSGIFDGIFCNRYNELICTNFFDGEYFNGQFT